MLSETLPKEEKEKILRTIESDREFRYAMMGLLGYTEVLNRITRLEERFTELGERVTKLEERVVKLEERFAELEERFIKLEERFAKLEERMIKLEERVTRIEEVLVEHSKRIEDLSRTVIVIAHRFGILTEEGLREAMRYVIQEVLGVAKVEKWVYRDSEGFVYGYPSIIEVDLVLRDKEHILIEVKSRVDRGDVYELYRIGKLYEKTVGIRPRLLVIGGFIEPRAYEIATTLGVEIRPILREYS